MEGWEFRIKETLKTPLFLYEWVISILKHSGQKFCVLLKWASTRLEDLQRLIFLNMIN